jgi:hypothetical protein
VPSPATLDRAFIAAAIGLLLAGCGGTSASPGNPATDFPAYPPGGLACAGSTAAFANGLLIGYAGDLATVGTDGFALRYQYLAGVLAPDPDCLSPTRTDAKNCGTAWWGTWQWDALPPGRFVTDFADATSSAGLLPMFTYYLVLPAAQARLGIAEGTPEVTVAAADVAFMTAYLDDFRFFLQKLGSRRAIVHVEPDFWGYAQHAARVAGTDATGLAAAVASANAADCAGLPDTIAGLGQCLVAMARKHAPNALVSLHASAWASGFDCVSNTMASLDVAAEAVKTADFLLACGAGGADLVTFDISDRDAGWYATQGRNSWLDAGDTTLPTFAQAFRWSSALTARLAKPGLWWQVPLGNRFMANRCDGWQDNKLDYFFDHPDRVAASGAVGVAFGSGASCQTSPETDGGRLKARARALLGAGGQPLCR